MPLSPPVITRGDVADVTAEDAVRTAIAAGHETFGRHTTPDEIAAAALYLASDASAMVTATTFAIDGGLSA
ncbi:SDR family oxidoreductase [Modestobacter lapidis]